MIVKLRAYRSYAFPDRYVPPSEDISVDSLLDASRSVRAWIERYELGGSNVGTMKVYDGKKVVALISFNGRVWSTEKDWQKRKELIPTR